MNLKYTKLNKQTYVKVGLRKINITVERGTVLDNTNLDPQVIEGLLSTGDFEYEQKAEPEKPKKQKPDKEKEMQEG